MEIKIQLHSHNDMTCNGKRFKGKAVLDALGRLCRDYPEAYKSLSLTGHCKSNK